jgi:hypothetical protein
MSYNINCFASKQTIRQGDACLVFPIQQGSTYHPVELARPTQAATRMRGGHR